MDGNGRWATRRGLPRAAGHRAGAEAFRRVVEAAPGLGVGTLTAYAFSSDNWKRPTAEVSALMALLGAYLRSEAPRLKRAGVRLGILSALAAGGTTSFTDLKTVLDLTDGNLSVHARKLEDAGYVSVSKSFADRTPLTEYALTGAGRAALAAYLDQMEAVIQAARDAS